MTSADITLFLSILLLSVAAFVIFLRPIWSVTFLYPAIHVLGGYPVAVGSVSISLERVILVFAGVGFVVYLLRTRKIPAMPLPLLFGWLAWLLAFVVTIFLFPTDIGLNKVLSLVQKMLFGYLVFLSFQTTEQVNRAIKLYILSTFVASFVTLGVYFSSGGAALIRSGSFIENDITVASEIPDLFLGLARAGAGGILEVFLCLLLLSTVKTRREKFLWIAIGVWLAGASTLALRREYLISLVACFLVVLLYRRTRFGSGGLAFLAIAGVLVFGLVTNMAEWSTRLFGETVTAFENNQDRRTLYFLSSLDAWNQSPFVGYGAGNWSISVRPYFFNRGPSLVDSLPSSHNSFTMTLVETGLLGGLPFLFVFGYMAARLTKLSRQSLDPQLKSVLSFSVVFLLEIFFWLFFGDAIMNNLTWYWLGLLAAIIVLGKAQLSPAYEPQRISAEPQAA